MPQPKEYKHIKAWGHMMRSYKYYVDRQQEQASEDNAPIDAVYEKNGKWHRYSEVENQVTRLMIDRLMEEM